MIEANHAGDRSVIAATAGLHPGAVVIGNVEIGEEVYIGPNAVIRHAPASSDLAEFALKVFGELAHEYQGRIKIVQMNVAENQETPARFGIRSIPALIFFKRGEAKQVIVGAQTKGHIEEELLKLL